MPDLPSGLAVCRKCPRSCVDPAASLLLEGMNPAHTACTGRCVQSFLLARWHGGAASHRGGRGQGLGQVLVTGTGAADHHCPPQHRRCLAEARQWW